MRRFSLVRSGLVAALLTASLTLGAAAASFGVGVVNASALRLRAQPTTSSSTLTQAYRGATVDVLADAADGWYQVSFNGQVGYMSAEYLLVTPLTSTTETEQDTSTEESLPSEESLSTEESSPTGQVILSRSNTLSIRAAASSSGERIGTVPNGTVLTLGECVNGWYMVTYNGVTGYVDGQYIYPIAACDSATGAAIAAAALKYVGCSYVYGASGPYAFDCSGLTSYVYRQLGYTINRGASSQMSNGTAVAYADLQPGDLVFFRDYSYTGAASHVGIYIGNGKFVHAANASSGVIVTSLSQTWYANRYVGARRIA